MEQKTTYVYSDELYHYGRKGMKWGQNIFGKKRSGAKGTVVAKKKKSLIDKAKEAKEAKKKAKAAAEEEARKRDPKNMTDADIRRAIERKKLENEYNQYYPKKVSRGKKLVNDMIDKALLPSLVESGKKFMVNAFDAFGKNIIDKYAPKEEPTEQQKLDKEYEKIKKQHDILDYKNKINKLKNPDKDDDISKLLSKARDKQALQELLDTEYQELVAAARYAEAKKKIADSEKAIISAKEKRTTKNEDDEEDD